MIYELFMSTKPMKRQENKLKMDLETLEQFEIATTSKCVIDELVSNGAWLVWVLLNLCDESHVTSYAQQDHVLVCDILVENIWSVTGDNWKLLL